MTTGLAQTIVGRRVAIRTATALSSAAARGRPDAVAQAMRASPALEAAAALAVAAAILSLRAERTSPQRRLRARSPEPCCEPPLHYVNIIAIDGKRSCDLAGRRDRNATRALLNASPRRRSPSRGGSHEPAHRGRLSSERCGAGRVGVGERDADARRGSAIRRPLRGAVVPFVALANAGQSCVDGHLGPVGIRSAAPASAAPEGKWLANPAERLAVDIAYCPVHEHQ